MGQHPLLRVIGCGISHACVGHLSVPPRVALQQLQLAADCASHSLMQLALRLNAAILRFSRQHQYTLSQHNYLAMTGAEPPI